MDTNDDTDVAESQATYGFEGQGEGKGSGVGAKGRTVAQRQSFTVVYPVEVKKYLFGVSAEKRTVYSLPCLLTCCLRKEEKA